MAIAVVGFVAACLGLAHARKDAFDWFFSVTGWWLSVFAVIFGLLPPHGIFD